MGGDPSSETIKDKIRFDVRRCGQMVRDPGFEPKKENSHKRILDADDGSGTMEYEEFINMMTHKILKRDEKDDILKAFRLFDNDETG